MKGIIFNLLEDYIENTFGAGEYEEMLAGCPLSVEDPELIVGPGTYPDRDFLAMVNWLALRNNRQDDEILRSFGRYSIIRLAERYPQFFNAYENPRDFLKSVGFIHHIEIRKLYKDAQTPEFSAEDHGEGRMRLRYRSKRHLCAFVEGLIDGLAEQYGRPITREKTSCSQSGGQECVFLLHFPGAA